MNKEQLYKKQVEALKGMFGNLAFVPEDFKCPKCHKDILEDASMKEAAEMGMLISSCPFCNKSFVD